MFVPTGNIPFTVVLSADEGGTYRSGVRVTGRKPDIRNFTTRIEYASAEVAGYLEIDQDSQVAVRSAERFIDGRPYSLQWSYYPMAIAKDTELVRREPTTHGTIALLRELGYEQVGTRDVIRIRMPMPDEKAFFRIGPGVPIVIVSRIAYTSSGQPIRLTRTVYPGDRNLLSYDTGTVPDRQLAEGEVTTSG
jgi:GntR family transcriptional regulator